MARRKKKSRSRAARLFAAYRAGRLSKRGLWAELAATRRKRVRRAKNSRTGYPSRRRHYGLYEWLDMEGRKRLVQRGTLDELNDWAKAQGMKWVREPGEMFGGHWHKAGRAYSFDLLSAREKRSRDQRRSGNGTSRQWMVWVEVEGYEVPSMVVHVSEPASKGEAQAKLRMLRRRGTFKGRRILRAGIKRVLSPAEIASEMDEIYRRDNPARRVYAVRVYEYPRGSRRAFIARAFGAPMREVIGRGRTAEEAMREAEAYLDRPPSKRRRR